MEKRKSRKQKRTEMENRVAELSERVAVIERFCEAERQETERLRAGVAELKKELSSRVGETEKGASIYQVVSEWLNGAEGSGT